MNFDFEAFPTPASELAKSIAQRKREPARATPHQLRRIQLEQDAERKAAERAGRKADKIPDPRLVDAVLVVALRASIHAKVSPTISIQAVVTRAWEELAERGYTPAVTMAALQSRLSMDML